MPSSQDDASPKSQNPIVDGDSLPPSETQSDQQDETRRPRRPRPKHDFPETQAGKMWKALSNPEGGPVNEMPGGTYNTAGGKPREQSWRDAFRWDVFNNSNRPSFYQTTCARDSLLLGIAGGGAVGGVGFIIRGLSRLLMTSNYAVMTFALVSGGNYWWCESRRREEAKGIAAAVAGMKMLHEKKAREETERKKQAEATRLRLQKEEEERRKASTWYKWW